MAICCFLHGIASDYLRLLCLRLLCLRLFCLRVLRVLRFCLREARCFLWRVRLPPSCFCSGLPSPTHTSYSMPFALTLAGVPLQPVALAGRFAFLGLLALAGGEGGGVGCILAALAALTALTALTGATGLTGAIALTGALPTEALTAMDGAIKALAAELNTSCSFIDLFVFNLNGPKAMFSLPLAFAFFGFLISTFVKFLIDCILLILFYIIPRKSPATSLNIRAVGVLIKGIFSIPLILLFPQHDNYRRIERVLERVLERLERVLERIFERLERVLYAFFCKVNPPPIGVIGGLYISSSLSYNCVYQTYSRIKREIMAYVDTFGGSFSIGCRSFDDCKAI